MIAVSLGTHEGVRSRRYSAGVDAVIMWIADGKLHLEQGGSGIKANALGVIELCDNVSRVIADPSIRITLADPMAEWEVHAAKGLVRVRHPFDGWTTDGSGSRRQGGAVVLGAGEWQPLLADALALANRGLSEASMAWLAARPDVLAAPATRPSLATQLSTPRRP